MTMFSDLPRDLVMSILSRIPLRSMREVRVTCKTLNTLSQSEIFSKMHLAKEVESREGGDHQRVVILDEKLSLMSVTFGDEDPSIEPKVKLSVLNQQVKVFKVFHCDGLLLCILKDDKRRIVVWNPYWGQTRWIEPRYTLYGFDRYRYTLGYAANENTSQRNHKLLRFMDVIFPRERFIWYEIYDFEFDQWTTFDVSPEWYIFLYHHGVSLRGKTYFCATKVTLKEEHGGGGEEEREDDEELDGHLICFDYTSESFGPLMHVPFSAGHHDYLTLSSVREEKLAVLLTHNESNQCEVWITTKIEHGEVSWSKFLTLYTKPEYPVSVTGFFIDEEKKVAMGFEQGMGPCHCTRSIFGEIGYLKKLVLGARLDKSYNRVQMCSYVPSSVQIKQPERVKRKRQCSLEQGRFDAKMSRLESLIYKKQSTKLPM